MSCLTADAIVSIWISPGITSGETLATHLVVGSTDAVVHFSDGISYVASFFTYQNIDRQRKKNRQTGEYLSGKYFWSSDMILIDSLDRNSIEAVIYDLLADGSFQSVFARAV